MNIIEYMAKAAATCAVREKQAGPWGNVARAAAPAVAGAAGGLIGGDTGDDIGDAAGVGSYFVPGPGWIKALGTAAGDLIPGLADYDSLEERQRFGGGKGAWGGAGRPLLSMAAHPVGTVMNWGRSLLPGTNNSVWGGNNRDVYEAQHGRPTGAQHDDAWYYQHGMTPKGANPEAVGRGEKMPFQYMGPMFTPSQQGGGTLTPQPQAPTAQPQTLRSPAQHMGMPIMGHPLVGIGEGQPQASQPPAPQAAKPQASAGGLASQVPKAAPQLKAPMGHPGGPLMA